MRAPSILASTVFATALVGAGPLAAQPMISHHPGAPFPGDVPAEVQNLGSMPRVQEQIADFYGAHAREMGGLCEKVAMTDILSAPTIGWYQDANLAKVSVNYNYAGLSDDAVCRGLATRVFVLERTAADSWEIADMWAYGAS